MTVKVKTLDGLESFMDVDAVYRQQPPERIVRACRLKQMLAYHANSDPSPTTIQIREYRLERYVNRSGFREYLYVEQDNGTLERLEKLLAERDKEIERLNRELGEAWANALQQRDGSF